MLHGAAHVSSVVYYRAWTRIDKMGKTYRWDTDGTRITVSGRVRIAGEFDDYGVNFQRRYYSFCRRWFSCVRIGTPGENFSGIYRNYVNTTAKPTGVDFPRRKSYRITKTAHGFRTGGREPSYRTRNALRADPVDGQVRGKTH